MAQSLEKNLQRCVCICISCVSHISCTCTSSMNEMAAMLNTCMVLCTILAVVGFRFRGGCTMCYIFHNALDFDDGKKMRFFFSSEID